jgi:hypothetical protein
MNVADSDRVGCQSSLIGWTIRTAITLIDKQIVQKLQYQFGKDVAQSKQVVFQLNVKCSVFGNRYYDVEFGRNIISEGE